MSAKIGQIGTVFAVLLALVFFSGGAWAQGSAAPGRSVGHVFLGMERADVWKILQKPHYTHTIPHAMSLYTEDIWNNTEYELSVVSERDKVIQVSFDSLRITTTDGLSTHSTLSQVRRRHPSMTVRTYALYDPADKFTETGYYLDDVRTGVAFVAEGQEGMEPDTLDSTLDTLIIHRPGVLAVPIFEGRWSPPVRSGSDPDVVHQLRMWFTPKGAGR